MQDMQDQLYDMTYAKITPYWKEELQSWFPQGINNRCLAIAACALSDEITLPKVLLRYMVAAIVRENTPSQVGIIGVKDQDDKLKVNLTMSADQYIALGRVLDNYQDIDLKLLDPGFSFSDRRNIALTISRKDLMTVIKKKMLSDLTWRTQLQEALLKEKQTFVAPYTTAPVPKGVGSSKK